MPSTAYIGIGSNLGSPKKNCDQAIDLIRNHPEISTTTQSPYYETEPVGPKNQGWFINAVIQVQTNLEPSALLTILFDVEKEMGRIRRGKWGPRIIDLDLLFYGDRVINNETLKLPHPEVANRRFVLEPLCDIAADFIHPVLKKTMKELLSQLQDFHKAHRIDESS